MQAPFRGPRVSEAKHTIIEAQRASEGYAARLQKVRAGAGAGAALPLHLT